MVPRRQRVFVEGGIYHVYNRFVRGSELFDQGDEADRFLALLRKAGDRDDLVIFAWCLMSNHYHVALRSGPVPLARTMGSVQTRFGQSFDRRWRSSGPRWQSRYKAILVEDPRYLNQLIAYIHLNSVTSGLVGDPAEYRRSGHLEVLGKVRDPLVDVDSVLAEFGESRAAARRGYVRWLRANRETEWVGEGPGLLPWWKVVPDRPLEVPSQRAWVDEQGVSSGRVRPAVSCEEFLSYACEDLEVTPARMSGCSQDRETSRIRCLVAALAIERWGVRAQSMAERCDEG